MIATGGPVRVDAWKTAPGAVAEQHRLLGFGESIAAPIMVDGAIWALLGAYGACGRDLASRLPAGSG